MGVVLIPVGAFTFTAILLNWLTGSDHRRDS